jgi:non-ribosomal peptide synthetase component F/acyl carrier protein
VSSNDKAVEELINEEVNTSFKLSEEHPLRGLLIQTPSDEHVLCITIHHISFDGWSRAIFIDELVYIFNTLKKGEQLSFETLSIQYADFSIWENEQFEIGALSEKLEYWKKKLEGTVPLNLFLDYPRGETQSQKGKLYQFYIDETLSEKFEKQAKKQDVSLFMFLTAVFKVLLYKYSGQTDIAIGTAIANRTTKEIEPLIGFFANTIVLKDKLDLNTSFVKFLESVKETTFEAYENQDVPFEKIVSEVADKQVTNRNPLFDVGFTLQNNPIAKNTELMDVSLTEESHEHNSAKFDLSVGMIRAGNGFNVDFEYSSDLFKEKTIQQMAIHFEELLAMFTENPHTIVRNSSILAPVDKKNILARYDKATTDVDKNETIIDVFKKQVEYNPTNKAIVCDNNTLTYQELDEKSNQFAHYLTHQGVKKGDMVPLLLENSFTMIIGIIGILKVGAIYIPLSKTNSKHLIATILKDINPNIVLSETKFKAVFGQNSNCNPIFIDADIEKLNAFSVDKTSVSVLSEDTSHIIYSWKNDRLNGVVNTHKALLASLEAIQNNYPLESSDRMLLMSDYAADTAIYELFGWMLSGASLVIVSSNIAENVPTFLTIVNDNNVTHINSSSWFLSLLLTHITTSLEDSDLSKLKQLTILDAELEYNLISQYKKLGLKTKLITLYGYNETMACCSQTVHDSSTTSTKSDLDNPFQGIKLYVLDDNLDIVPDGTAGCLYVSGMQLANGYLNNATLTSENFVVNPYGDENYKHLYKTGDLARWSNTRTIEIIRRDNLTTQFKEYRIDLEVIATVIEKYEGVERASVFIKKEDKKPDVIVAYILVKEIYEEEPIALHLEKFLPTYMIPQLYVKVEEFPLDVDGKVNRIILQQKINKYVLKQKYEAPQTDIEKTLVLIWEELLEVEQIGIMDDFFDLGGRSLLVISVISKIEEKLNIQLPFLTLFNYTTIKNLANYIQLSSSSTEPDRLESEYEFLDI